MPNNGSSARSLDEHLNEADALLDAALRIIRDQGIPVSERLIEVDRALVRVSGHCAAAELLVDTGEPA